MRPEGPWQKLARVTAGFSKGHVLSETKMISPSRAPLRRPVCRKQIWFLNEHYTLIVTVFLLQWMKVEGRLDCLLRTMWLLSSFFSCGWRDRCCRFHCPPKTMDEWAVKKIVLDGFCRGVRVSAAPQPDMQWVNIVRITIHLFVCMAFRYDKYSYA